MATDEIRLSTYGETIEIQQGLNGRVVLQVQTDDGHAAPVLTPPECDALIAAIGRALGRPAPTSTPLEERIATAAAVIDDDASKLDYGPMRWEMRGRAEGLRAALAMVREQGATVPRAPLSEALPLLVELRSFLPFGRASRLVDLVTCYVTDALGVALPEKSAAPTTQMEKG